MAEPLQVKGTSISGVVAALKASRRFKNFVPQRLQRYLDKPIFVSNWYPAQDYFDLLEALAKTADPRVTQGDPYFFFGRVGAQRDLKGRQDLLPTKQRTTTAGLYRRSLASSQEEASLGERIQRILRARRLYYSAGSFNVQRIAERTLQVRLDDFPVVSANLCALSTGYWTEAFSGDEFAASIRKASCRALNRPACTWEIAFGPQIDVSDLVAFESKDGVVI